jgi:hypothetical protein
MDTTEKITAFFKAYENRFNNALKGEDNIEETAAAFADCFIGANPTGVFCGSNNNEFKIMIPKGNQFYRDIGTVSMTVDGIAITELDDMHVMAKVSWKSLYIKNSEQIIIPFYVIYLLQQQNGTFKIFAYITGDEQRVLKEYGLLPVSKAD